MEVGPFWPFFISDGEMFKKFVVSKVILPRRDVTEKGHGNNGIFADNPLEFKLIGLALKIAF